MKIPETLKDHSCTCKKCKDMCKKTPCLGTPEDILRIAKAGFADKLSPTQWLAGMVVGTHSAPVAMVAPNMTKQGCAFQDNNGLCILHDLGLKPTEGKISSSHNPTMCNSRQEILENAPAFLVAAEWEKCDYENIRRRVFRNIKK